MSRPSILPLPIVIEKADVDDSLSEAEQTEISSGRKTFLENLKTQKIENGITIEEREEKIGEKETVVKSLSKLNQGSNRTKSSPHRNGSVRPLNKTLVYLLI